MRSVTNRSEIYHQNKKRTNVAHLLVEECIETSFFELLKEKNFEDITITEIIAKAGVSRMGFYRNFSSKEDIIENLVFRCFHEAIEEITKTRKLDFSVTKVIETSLERLKEHSEQMQLLVKNNLTPLIFTFYEKAFFSLYQPNKKSRIREYSAMMFLGELFTLEMAWIKNGMIETPKEMAKIYCKLLTLKCKNL